MKTKFTGSVKGTEPASSRARVGKKRDSSSIPTDPRRPTLGTKLTDEQLLQQANELDAAYAHAHAFHAVQPNTPTRTVYRINWDNGASACGTFPEDYPTEEAAQTAADAWAAEWNARDGIDPDSEEGYTAEVIEVEVPDPEATDEDPMAELRKAALNQGQP